MKKRTPAFVVTAMAVCATCLAGLPNETATINPKGDAERLDVEGGRLVKLAVQELILHHLYRITYEEPRLADPGEYVDITQQVTGRPANSEQQRILWPRSRKMSVDLQPSRGIEFVLNQVVSAAEIVHPEMQFRVVSDGTMFHVIPADGSLLDTRISLPGKERTLEEAVKAIAAALTSASHRSVNYGCCAYEMQPDEPRYPTIANDESARGVLQRLLESLAVNRGPATWIISYDKKFDHFTLLIMPMPEEPVYQIGEELPKPSPRRYDPAKDPSWVPPPK